MANKRGNPNFGKSGAVPAIATSFEEMVKTLGLSKAQYETSDALKEWVLRNRNSKYVPLALLEAWGFPVDVD